MPKRKLRIVKRAPLPVIGVCEACDQQFKSSAPMLNKAEWQLSQVFAHHKCKPVDSSQNALRIVRESTEGK
jgi:hypothetical protein